MSATSANMIRYSITIAYLVMTSLLLTGCDQAEVVENIGPSKANSLSSEVLARTDTASIHHRDLPLSDQIKLYNLDYQVYQLTSASLRETIERQGAHSQTVQWQLPTPDSPKAHFPLIPDWTLGNESSPWQLQLFCTLQSRPCSDLLVELSALAKHTKQDLYVQYYHFWHGFHKHAVKIAGATHCMQPSAKPSFLEALQTKQGQIDMAVLSAAIDLYSPAADKVYKCMQNDETLTYLSKRYDQIQQAGIRKAPSVFLNGHYLARGYELSQLFVAIKDDIEMISSKINHDLEWLQSWKTNNARSPSQDWALTKNNESVMRVSVGSRIGDFYIASVTEHGFGLYKDGKVEFIGQPQTSENQLYSTNQSTSADLHSNHQAITTSIAEEKTTNDHNEKFIPHDAKARYEAAISQLPKQALPQNWLDQQLMRQSELEQDFQLSDGQFEDKSLVKLSKDDIDPFYKTLGMKPGDVIMRVNDEWIHEQSNTLFQTLANEESVTISVMRKGKPVHLAFQVTP
ncbi:thioredoxin domain-containing protein [Bermanella marisrubri]|uniref:Agmatinase n=1 Tax=Bermanella marisrubri TaxID=207949 RepID=Q1N5V3_9GAMM|nr:thioredoxin domain-containing protein [Bermanella marisrubri]EAT13839.1 agmatinase [Oceanobacter sp. RED65] [Bermanella marisrubri]QIZ84602.1 thioredoxin domain-containing protein [Bermanella marisrubri]